MKFLVLFGFLVASIGAVGQSNPLLVMTDPNFHPSPPNTSAAGIPIRFYGHGEDSLAARLAAIRGAQSSISILTYIFNPCDSSTKLLLDAMIDRAKAGVKVQLIVDQYDITSVNPNKPAEFAAYLKKRTEGFTTPIDFRLYVHPNYGTVIFNPIAADNRAHIKILLIDSGGPNPVYFVGGRNNSDGYFGLSKVLNYFDQDVMVTGDSAKQVQTAFDTILEYATLSTPSSSQDSSTFDSTCMATTTRDNQVATVISEKSQTVLANSPIYYCPSVTFAMDDPRYRMSQLGQPINNDDLPQARLAYKHSTAQVLKFMRGTANVLHLVNQYFMPVFKLDRDLVNVQTSGKDLVVMTNSTGDEFSGVIGEDETTRMTELTMFAIQAAATKNSVALGLSSLGALNDDGDLSVPGALWRIHTKTGVRDHKDVLISSFNVDSRSYQINAEDSLLIPDCPNLAYVVEEEYQKMVDIWQEDQSCSACEAQWQQNLDLMKGAVPPGYGLLDYFL